jgi:hypothetical protein
MFSLLNRRTTTTHQAWRIPIRRFVSSSSSSKQQLDQLDSKSNNNDNNALEPLGEEGEWAGCKRSFMQPLKISVRGSDILFNPLFNKGTTFKTGERDRLRLRGLLPARITNIALEKERFLKVLRAEESTIKKNILLEDLHDRNETLYHRILVEEMEEMAPLIYTPTVGQACVEFADRYDEIELWPASQPTSQVDGDTMLAHFVSFLIVYWFIYY